MKGCHTGTGRPCHESPPAGKSCRERGWRMHIKNVLLRGRGELFLAPKSFPSPPQTPPLPSKRALQKQANDQPAIGKAVPTGAKAFRPPGCDLAQRKRARENEQHRHRKAGLQKDSSKDKIISPCTRSPLPQAARSVMPCPCRPVVRGCRRSCEREREDRGRRGPALSSSFRISGIHTTGREQEWQ